MPGGGRDASSTLWWSLGKASPQAPALGGPSGPGQALGDPCGPAPIPRGRFFALFRPGPCAFMNTPRCPRFPQFPCHTDPLAHPCVPPPPDPSGEKVSLWVGGAWGRCLVFHCPGPSSWESCDLSSNMTLLQPYPARDLREVTFFLCASVSSSVIRVRSFPLGQITGLPGPSEGSWTTAPVYRAPSVPSTYVQSLRRSTPSPDVTGSRIILISGPEGQTAGMWWGLLGNSGFLALFPLQEE